MIIVYITPIKNLTDTEIARILNSLSENSIARLNKKRNEAQHLSSLCALSLIPKGMSADLDHAESGKPFFKTLDASISISHSEKFAAIALSTSKNEKVGIDVEDIDKFTANHSFARFFTENERKSIETGTSEIEIWTKKEALFKHLSTNISFISLDTATAIQKFTTLAVDNSLVTVCTDQNAEIEFIHM